MDIKSNNKKICVCGKYGRYRCTRCNEKYYCSKSCQRKDWSLHKEQCTKKYKEIGALNLERMQSIMMDFMDLQEKMKMLH